MRPHVIHAFLPRAVPFSAPSRARWVIMPVTIPLITLLTDFGDRDYFVAHEGRHPQHQSQAQIVDLSHRDTA